MILPDHLAPGLRVVFCGTAPGAASARAGHYYARATNRFWRMLAEGGLTPRLYRPEEDHRLPALGIGLTDLSKTAFGQDAKIPAETYDPEGLFAKVRQHGPAILAFTSLTAARLALGRPRLGAGVQEGDARVPGVALWALPSPSALAQSHFSAGPWRALAEAVAALPPQSLTQPQAARVAGGRR